MAANTGAWPTQQPTQGSAPPGGYTQNLDGTITGPDGTVYPIGATMPNGQQVPYPVVQAAPTVAGANPDVGNGVKPTDGSAPPTTNSSAPVDNGGSTTGGTTTLPSGQIGSLIKPYDGTAPSYVNPAYPTAPTLGNIPIWQSPTADQASNLPGYQFARDQGVQAMDNSAAARGVTNTGGTLQDIIKFGDQFAAQNYQTARQNSLDDYSTNVTNQYLLPYQAKQQQWAIQNPQASTDAQNANTFNWNNYLQGYNIYRNQKLDTTNQLYSLANLGATVS